MNHPNRRSIRLKGYDYAQKGAYYITICTQGRLHLFGEVRGGEMVLNDAGKMVEMEWLKIKHRFSNVDLGEYVVMPNHFHGILVIVAPGNGRPNVDGQPDVDGQPQGIAHTIGVQNVGAPLVGAQNVGAPFVGAHNETAGDMVGAFKSITTVEYIRGVKNNGWRPFRGKLWQRNYYEHIIRDGNDYDRITNYIRDNPMNW